jgi:hypothetical protein
MKVGSWRYPQFSDIWLKHGAMAFSITTLSILG